MDPTSEPHPTAPLLPGEWPGVRAAYRFAAGPEPSLAVRLEFRPERLADDAASLADAAEAALARIGPMLLEDPGTRYALTTSLQPSDASGLGDGDAVRAALAAFAEAIASALEAIRDRGSIEGVAAIACTLTAPVSLAQLAGAGDDLIPVTVDLTLSRAGAVVPGPGAAAPARETRSDSIPPDLEQGLPAFAEAFEAAWRGYDSGEGTARLLMRDDAGAASGDALWAMRWSPTAGMHVSFGEPACFALGPLSTRLLDGTATVRTYDADFEPSGFTAEFRGIDLDVWADNFFRALDEVLSPATSAALDRVAPDALASLAADRARLAKAVARGLIPITAPSPSDVEEAARCFEQRLIESPGAAYGLGVIQLPATVAATTATALRLSGDVTEAGSGTLARREAAEAWHLTFAALLPEDATELRLAPRWRARTLERGGERLRFVLPASAPEHPLPAVRMPVPARGIPGAPALTSQAAPQSDAEPSPNGLPRWDYALEIGVAAPEPQDDLWLRIEYNVPLEDVPASPPTENVAVPSALAPLFDALASFHGAWSALAPAVRDLVDAELEDARALRLASAVAERVSAVADAWEAVERGEAMRESLAPLQGGDTFVLRFRSLAEGTVEVLCRADETGPGRLVWPTLNGAGPSAGPMAAADPPGPGEWLAATYPVFSPGSGHLEITLPAMDPLERQTARARSWRVRNAALPNPAFVHRSTVAGFPSPVVPELTEALMGPFAPAETLAATLRPVLELLAATGTTTGLRRTLGGTVRYRYPLPGTEGTGMELMAEIPVRRFDGIELADNDVAGIADKLAADIDAWRAATQPDTLGAHLAFEYAVWAESAWRADARPAAPAIQLLRFPDVRYDIPVGWWMPE